MIDVLALHYASDVVLEEKAAKALLMGGCQIVHDAVVASLLGSWNSLPADDASSGKRIVRLGKVGDGVLWGDPGTSSRGFEPASRLSRDSTSSVASAVVPVCSVIMEPPTL